MSRIQDILAKAERDGTARRTQADLAPRPAATASVAPAPAPPISGTSALEPAMFPATETAAPAGTQADGRSAVATLHPLLVAAIEVRDLPGRDVERLLLEGVLLEDIARHGVTA